ncbi:unnamed protein product, partial [Staurois parvus]
ILHFRGGRLHCLPTALLPVSLGTLLWIAEKSHPEQCAYSEAHTPSPIVKHSHHTVNPLIAPHVNPFLPSAISTVSVLFF